MEKSYTLSLSSDFFYPKIHDMADEHIIDVIVKVFARNGILIMAGVVNGPQLDSYKFKNQSLCKSFKHFTSSAGYSQYKCIVDSGATTANHLRTLEHADFREARCFVKNS